MAKRILSNQKSILKVSLNNVSYRSTLHTKSISSLSSMAKKATTYYYVAASLGGVKLDQKMARRRREILGATNHHRQPNRHLQKQPLNHIEVSMIYFFNFSTIIHFQSLLAISFANTVDSISAIFQTLS